MVVLVEAIALEGDADLAEHLLHGGAADVVLSLVSLGAHGERIVGERLEELEHLAGAFTSVVVGRHGLGGYPAVTIGPPLAVGPTMAP